MAEDFKQNGTHSLDPQTQYVHSCSGYTIGSCKLEPMKTPNGQCTKRCRWLKVTKTQKTLEKQKKTIFRESWLGPPLPKSLQLFFFFFFFPGFYLFSESLGWAPPSKESRNIVFFLILFYFPRFLPSVEYFKETSMNHRQSCQSAFGSAVKHLKISS